MPTETEAAHEKGLHYGAFHSWCPACVAERQEDDRAREAQNAADIDRLTCEFANRVDEALTAAVKTRQAVAELVSNQVYDVEMEGATGGDALAELDTALRALRNVKRIAQWRRSLMLADPGSTP